MKEKILEKLKANSPEYVSGEEISEGLGVSRTAVWKHIRELKDEGYEIESSTKKGYRLIAGGDILNVYELSSSLGKSFFGRNIEYFPTIDSTNNQAKKLAAEGCPDGTLVVADIQSAGRGRLGRDWVSPGGTGIWMSVVLRPSVHPSSVQLMTLAAAVSVVNGIKAATGIVTGIKWPNDIVLQGRKVCGILTEMSCEMDRINYIVVGIGLNVSQEEADFPEDLREKAVSLKSFLREEMNNKANFAGNLLQRSGIIKFILADFEEAYKRISQGEAEDILKSWRKMSVTLGKRVFIEDRNGSFTGTAEDITQDGKLIVRCDDDSIKELLSGEVSVRGLLGYI